MRSRHTVTSDNTPPIRHKTNTSVTHSNHGLDSNTHTFFKKNAIASSSIIGNLWLFMHFFTDSMTGKFTHYSISKLFTMLLNSPSDVTKMIACNGLLYTFI